MTTQNLAIVELTDQMEAKVAAINDALILLDAAIGGRVPRSVAGSADVTLTSTEARNAVIELTGALTGDIDVLIPILAGGRNRWFIIYNNTTGAFTLTVKTDGVGSTGIAIPQGYVQMLWHDGGNVRQAAGPTTAGVSSLHNNLIAFWRLEEASGTRNDSKGTNHLTDNNTVTQATGKVGFGAQFTIANSEYLSIADNADVSTGDIDFTFACWVYLDAKATTQMIVGKSDATAGNREYHLYYNQSTDRFLFEVHRATDTGASATANNFGSPTVGTWYFIVGWHDAAADTVNIQVNNGTADSTATGGALQASGTAEFDLGRRSFGGSNLYLGGRLDAVGLWKRVLTASERTELFAGAGGREYPF